MSKAAELAALIGGQQAQGDRNFVINGDMQCWQRASAATASNNSYSTVDRWAIGESTDGAYTTERSTDTPTGTGFSAKTFTVSFWVKSNKTGTYTISIQKRDATVYYLPIEYTINSADTWEKKTITVSPTAGSTSFITASAGAIANDNGQGIQLGFGLAWGSQFNGGTSNTWSASTHYATSNHVNWMDSTSNNFYLAQVQLEIGEVATAFEHEDFETTLAKCQRYFSIRENNHASDGYYFAILTAYNTTSVYGLISNYPVTMRSTPTVSQSGSFGAYQKTSANASFPTTIGTLGATTYGWFTGGWASGSGLVAGDASVMFSLAGAKLMADAEL